MAVRKHPRQYQGRTTMPRAQADQDAFPRRHRQGRGDAARAAPRPRRSPRHGVHCYARGDVCTRGVPADPAHAAARHGGHLGETPSRAKEHEDRLEALASYLSRALTDDQVYSIIDPTPIGACDHGSSIDTAPGGTLWLRTGPRQAASCRSRVGGTVRWPGWSEQPFGSDRWFPCDSIPSIAVVGRCVGRRSPTEAMPHHGGEHHAACASARPQK
jgi:hypothetical protein